jgi:hypothetical protein
VDLSRTPVSERTAAQEGVPACIGARGIAPAGFVANDPASDLARWIPLLESRGDPYGDRLIEELRRALITPSGLPPG